MYIVTNASNYQTPNFSTDSKGSYQNAMTLGSYFNDWLAQVALLCQVSRSCCTAIR